MNWDAYWGLAVVESERQRLREHRRAVLAAAIWSELAGLGARLFADSQRIMYTSAENGRLPRFSPLNVSVFAANREEVRDLFPDHGLDISELYQLIIQLSAKYASLNGSTQVDDSVARRTGQHIAVIVEHVRFTLYGFSGTAGLAQDQARAAMMPWTP